MSELSCLTICNMCDFLAIDPNSYRVCSKTMSGLSGVYDSLNDVYYYITPSNCPEVGRYLNNQECKDDDNN